MKKLLYCILILIPLLGGCGNKLTTYEEISYDEFTKKIENKEDFILFIGSETCQHCAAFKDTVNSVVKNYQIKIYYIDINKFDDSEKNKFKTIINFNATPTTVFIKNGLELTDENGNVTIYRISGNIAYEKVINKIKKAGFINE